jgi:hypothetical protein
VRIEEDVLPVRRPVEDAVVDAAARRKRADVVVERELPGLSALGADDEHLPAAAVVAGEGDPAAIGRELREVLHPLAGGETARVAAAGRSEPDVAGVNERDGAAVNVGLAQKPRQPFLRERARGGCQERENRDELFHSRCITRHGACAMYGSQLRNGRWRFRCAECSR